MRTRAEMARVRETRRIREARKRAIGIHTVGVVIVIAGLLAVVRNGYPWLVFYSCAAFGAATAVLGFFLKRRAERQLAAMGVEAARDA